MNDGSRRTSQGRVPPVIQVVVRVEYEISAQKRGIVGKDARDLSTGKCLELRRSAEPLAADLHAMWREGRIGRLDVVVIEPDRHRRP